LRERPHHHSNTVFLRVAVAVVLALLALLSGVASPERQLSDPGGLRRSGGDVKDCRAEQSENNKSKRGLRVVEHSWSWSPLGPPTTPREQTFYVAVTLASNGTVRTLGC
jgi:hypothetical protein